MYGFPSKYCNDVPVIFVMITVPEVSSVHHFGLSKSVYHVIFISNAVNIPGRCKGLFQTKVNWVSVIFSTLIIGGDDTEKKN